MSTVVTTLAEPIIEVILKKIANGAIRHLGRDAVEEIARDVIKEEIAKINPQQIYSPTLIINLTVTVDDVYAILGNDNRFIVAENEEITLSAPELHISSEPDIDETRRLIGRVAIAQLRQRISEHEQK